MKHYQRNRIQIRMIYNNYFFVTTDNSHVSVSLDLDRNWCQSKRNNWCFLFQFEFIVVKEKSSIATLDLAPGGIYLSK